jgi:hypothetical protein
MEIMMEILERSDTGWHVDHNCTGWGNGNRGCNSSLRVSKEDLVYYPGVKSESWGQKDPAVSFKCPICDACTDLGKKDWPQNASRLRKVGSVWYEGGYQERDSGDK